MRIGGLQKFSMIDFPGKLAAVIFTQGCNFRCPYCHNPELVDPEHFDKPLDELDILAFLNRRIGKLDGVVITGGEPTLHPDLPLLITKIRSMGFAIKLDTNGSNPALLKDMLQDGLIDYCAMDIKAPAKSYKKVTRSDVDIALIKESIKLIKQSGVEYEFRSTLVGELLSPEEILEMGSLIGRAKRLFLQKFVSTKTLDERYGTVHSFSDDALVGLKAHFDGLLAECHVR